MTLNSKAFLFAALLGATAASPLSAVLADPVAANQIATTPDGQSATGPYDPTQQGTAPYDNFDRFRDPSGRPLQGYGYLFAVPGAG
jgi:hypothetical protein